MASYTCTTCQTITKHVSMRQAARIAQKNPKTIRTWVAKGWVTCKEFPSGRVSICRQCLLKPKNNPAASAAGRP